MYVQISILQMFIKYVKHAEKVWNHLYNLHQQQSYLCNVSRYIH